MTGLDKHGAKIKRCTIPTEVVFLWGMIAGVVFSFLTSLIFGVGM